MAVNTENITVSSLDSIMGFDNAGDLLFAIDEMQDCTIANTEEKTDITGRGGRKLSSLKKNKAVTISGTNGLFSGNLLAVQTGTAIQDDTTAPVQWMEVVTVKSNAAATEFKATGTAGNELKLYKRNINGTQGEPLTQVASSPAAGQFAYTPASKAITFAEDDFDDDTELIAIYERTLTNVAVVTNMSDTYSQTCRLVIDATGKDTCDNIFHIQFQVPRADFSGNFDIQMGGDQVVQAFEAESLAATGCGTSSAIKGKFWDMIIFGGTGTDESNG